MAQYDVLANTRTPRGAATYRRIVEAAGVIVAQRGMNQLSLDGVCAEANVSKGQLYHYFSSRQDIVVALTRHVVAETLRLQSALFEQLHSMAGLQLWVSSVVQFHTRRGAVGGCPIGSLVSQLDRSDDLSREVVADGFHQWQMALEAGIASMVQSGQLDDSIDPSYEARLLVVALEGGLLLTDVYRSTTWLREALDARLQHLRDHLIFPR
jgi:AcrR family transcriptional regulator